MAILVSPGVDITVSDTGVNGSAGPGTVPLIVIATAGNKPNPTSTGTALYTTELSRGTLFNATSQRDLRANFGKPYFWNSQGTELHGHELNEYGLLAADSYLGISSRAIILRADIDTLQLLPLADAPRAEPVNGTHWLDLQETNFGVFQSNGNVLAGLAWTPKSLLKPEAANLVNTSGILFPVSGYGANGDYAIVTSVNSNYVFERIAGNWLRLGTAAWKQARPTKIRGSANPSAVVTNNSIIINGTTVVFSSGVLANIATAIASAGITNISAAVVSNALEITNSIGGNIVLANGVGTPLTTLGLEAKTYFGARVVFTNDASYPDGSNAGDVWIKGTSTNLGASWSIKRYNSTTGTFSLLSAPFFPFTSTLVDGNATKDAAAILALIAPSVGSVYVGYDAATGVQQPRRWNGSSWEALVYEASVVTPSTPPEDGTFWYSADCFADIMVGNGSNWLGYRQVYPDTNTDGVIMSGSKPEVQTDGTPLVDNDLWIDTSDLDNYPALRRFNAGTGRWVSVDTTDQTTPFGIVFADARADSGVVYTGIDNAGDYEYDSALSADLALSAFVDPDAPNPRNYPSGMMLFNTRASTYNVKVWRPAQFKGTTTTGFGGETDFTREDYTVGSSTFTFPALADAGRWVTASGNKQNGAPHMGRKAQRAMIVKAMAAAIVGNEDIRSEAVIFNLIAAPGYPELADEMVALNNDQKQTAFVVADTPIRLKPNEVSAWASNVIATSEDGEDGIKTNSPYLGVYYPWGLASNIDGARVMVPPSMMALRTIAYSDSVSFPWFAPMGFARGLVDNAESVGYLTSEGEFSPVILNQGQRDALSVVRINPIAYIVNRGLVLMGQKTMSPTATQQDRVNIARLVNYVKANLDEVVWPFVAQPNDQQTRDSARRAVERFFTSLVQQRAVEDFAVKCDEDNNDGGRRSRKELWIDVAFIPVGAVEFIYVPLRLVEPGGDL